MISQRLFVKLTLVSAFVIINDHLIQRLRLEHQREAGYIKAPHINTGCDAQDGSRVRDAGLAVPLGI